MGEAEWQDLLLRHPSLKHDECSWENTPIECFEKFAKAMSVTVRGNGLHRNHRVKSMFEKAKDIRRAQLQRVDAAYHKRMNYTFAQRVAIDLVQDKPFRISVASFSHAARNRT